MRILKGGLGDERVYSLHSSQILQAKSIRAGKKYFAVFVFYKERKRDSLILVYKQSEFEKFDPKLKDAICSLRIREYIPLTVDEDFFNLNYFFKEVEIDVDKNNDALYVKGQANRKLDKKDIVTVKEEVLVLISPIDGSLRHYRIIEPKLKFLTSKPSEAKSVLLKIENLKSSVEFAPVNIYKEPFTGVIEKPAPKPKLTNDQYEFLKLAGLGAAAVLIIFFSIWYVKKKRIVARKERILREADFVYNLTEYQFNDCYF